MNKAFTIGHTKNYDKSLAEDDNVKKVGREEGYESGYVWAKAEEARNFIVSKEFLMIDWVTISLARPRILVFMLFNFQILGKKMCPNLTN